MKFPSRLSLLVVNLAILAVVVTALTAEPRSLAVGGFAFDLEVIVAGTPEEVFDAFTGETLEWWDHHFSEHPRKLYFEPRPGGGFYEIFDEAGNGARHATVTYAERGKRLRFVGPLGLAGNAIDIVHTLDFEDVEEGTRLRLAVQATGAVQEGWPEVVERVWRHFLDERFRPYMAGRVRASGGGGAEHPFVSAIRAYRGARKRGDTVAVRAILADDARIWFGSREGPGRRVDPVAGGPWHDWDRFFDSGTELRDFRVEGTAVRATVTEINEWYRLVHRSPREYYMTWWFDDDRRILGMMVHPIPDQPPAVDRLDEFKTWARAERPGLLERLMPDGEIDPALENARLWKRALLDWREVAGSGRTP